MAAQILRQDLLELMGAGNSLTEVATMLKVTPSAISQAIDADEELKREIASLQHARGAEMDDAYDDIEKTLLRRLKQQISMVGDPLKTARILQTVNSAKRRTGIMAQPQRTGAPTITLLMPVAIQQKIDLTTDKQVVAVDNRPLVTMPAGNVLKMLQDKQTRDALPLGEVI